MSTGPKLKGANLKRFLDLTASIIGLILLSPLFFALAIAIWFNLGRPVLFKQLRPGLRGKLFTMCKFRTMRNAVDSNGKPLPDVDRMTWLGSLLRRSSLDELPELMNVLWGDMSLVGPRPLLVEYLNRYTTDQARRHEVKPGITGWAQINGRNAISWEEKFALDVWYVDNHTIFLDLKILLLTIWKVVRREGVSADQHVTMPVFMGSKAPEHESL